MSDDREIERQIWEGKVPIVFNLALNEVTTEEPPEPYYLLAPRCTYLPLVTAKVLKHFQSTGADTEEEMWFDFSGQPLKWHYPIGVLFDFYGSPSQLPWSLTVHFQGFPDNELLRCQEKDCVQSHLISAIKEADYLKSGSTKKIFDMTKSELKQLWMGLKTFKFDQFWSINKRLAHRTETGPIKHVPFRIYVPDQPVIQEPFPPFRPDGSEYVLGDLLATILPDLFPTDKVSPYLHGNAAIVASANGGSSSNRPSTTTASSTTSSDEATTDITSSTVVPSGKDDELPQVIIHGISPSFDTPLLWLSEHCSHPDNFLHICVLTNESKIK